MDVLNIEQHRGPTYNWTDGLDGIGYLGVGWDSPDELYRGANNQNSVLIQYYWTRLEEKRMKKCSSGKFLKNGLSWTFEYDIWIELDLGKGRVEESEGRKESSTAESGE